MERKEWQWLVRKREEKKKKSLATNLGLGEYTQIKPAAELIENTLSAKVMQQFYVTTMTLSWGDY